jgi:hypothetical protein
MDAINAEAIAEAQRFRRRGAATTMKNREESPHGTAA